MKLRTSSLALAILAIFALSPVRAETPAAQPDAAAMTAIQQNSIAGLWSTDSVSMAPDGGMGKVYVNDNQQQPVNLTVGDKQFTMRIGDKVLADMTYELNAKEMPWTIDLKSGAGNLLGVCIRTGTMLRMVLNDEAKGRPQNFNQSSGGMVLMLRQATPRSLFTINADGSDLKRVLTMPDYTFIGSPDWSHDGQHIAVDGWHALYGEEADRNEVLVISADGTDVKSLDAGCMPSWSPDDKQIVFGVRGQGVWIMNADGSDRRQIAADGWGAQWSPTRNEIAFHVAEGDRANLYIYDVASSQRRPLLKKAFAKVFIGISWSPDSNWICFKGIPAGGAVELVAVSTEGEEKGLKVLLPEAMPDAVEFDNTVAWGGDGNQILVSAGKRAGGPQRLALIDFTGKEKWQWLPGYPEQFGHANMAWSSDGKRVVFTAAPPLQPAGRTSAPVIPTN